MERRNSRIQREFACDQHRGEACRAEEDRLLMKNKRTNKTIIIAVLEIFFRIAIICAIFFFSNHYIGNMIGRIVVAIVCIIVFAIVDVSAYRHFFREEYDEALGWQRLWLYPSNLISVAYSITVISLLILTIICFKKEVIDQQSIIIGLVTGLVASSIVVIFTEMSSNYEKNMKRMAVLNDYFCMVYYYIDDCEINRQRIRRKVETDNFSLVDLDSVKECLKELDYTPEDLEGYSSIDLQAIAWEVVEYHQLITETINNHTELLYRDEIECLSNIMFQLKMIASFESLPSEERLSTIAWEKNLGIEGNSKAEHSQKEFSYERLKNIAAEENLLSLSGIAISLIIIDKNLQRLKRHILYLNDKEYRHLKHLTNRIRNLPR